MFMCTVHSKFGGYFRMTRQIRGYAAERSAMRPVDVIDAQ